MCLNNTVFVIISLTFENKISSGLNVVLMKLMAGQFVKVYIIICFYRWIKAWENGIFENTPTTLVSDFLVNCKRSSEYFVRSKVHLSLVVGILTGHWQIDIIKNVIDLHLCKLPEKIRGCIISILTFWKFQKVQGALARLYTQL